MTQKSPRQGNASRKQGSEEWCHVGLACDQGISETQDVAKYLRDRLLPYESDHPIRFIRENFLLVPPPSEVHFVVAPILYAVMTLRAQS